MEEKVLRIFLRRYEKIGHKGGIAKVIFDDEFEDIAQEIVKVFSIHYVSQQRELLIGYSKLILGDNYEAFEEFELKKIDEYLANL